MFEFELDYMAAQAGSPALVPMPTIGIIPVSPEPLPEEVAQQLTHAVNAARAAADQGERFDISTQPEGGWIFAALMEPRSLHDGLTEPFVDHLITCLHALDDEMPDVAALNVLLTGGILDNDRERDLAFAAGRQMRDHWREDECATRRNELPFFEANRARLTAATRGMLTDEFDARLYNGQGLLDLIRALYGLFYHPGGLWPEAVMRRLDDIFTAGVSAGFLTAAEVEQLSAAEYATFWDWAITALALKPTVIRSLLTTVAESCVDTVAELGEPFALQRCMRAGRLELVTLRVAGVDYYAAAYGR